MSPIEHSAILLITGFLLVGGLVMFTYYEWDHKITSAIGTAIREACSKLGRELQI